MFQTTNQFHSENGDYKPTYNWGEHHLVQDVTSFLNNIWANYNNSLTWIKAIKGDDFPY